jgi:hypothetical protein
VRAGARGTYCSILYLILQCDLVALDSETAVISMKLYLDTGGGTVVPVLVLSSLGIPAAGDYWLHPDVLKDAERVANDELIVLHMPAEIGGQTYQAVRFEYHPEGAEYVWMFDQDSGLLLFYRHRIGGENDAHKQLTDITLVGLRQLDLPWADGTVPGWLAEGGYMRYDGTYTALVMGSPAGSFPYVVLAEVKAVRPRWSAFLLTDSVSGQSPSLSWRVTGGTQVLDALWLPPEALDALRDRQVLDRDPITGSEIKVSRGHDGSITLTESNTAYHTALKYDGSDGALLDIEQQVITGAAGNVIQLELSGRQ